MRKKISKKRVSQKGLSPVVTTVLLISLTIAITVTIFFWFRSMVNEVVTKFSPPQNIQMVCDDVMFEASYDSGTFNIKNIGTVPIYRVDLRIGSAGNEQTKDIKTDFDAGSNWPASGLTQGNAFSGDIGSEIGSVDQITVYPVLIGTSSKGKKTFMCQGQYGKQIL